MSDWPAITTEEVSWHLRDEDAYLIPKSRRRKITPQPPVTQRIGRKLPD